MSSLDLIPPRRVEELLGGAFPETDREATLQGLAVELRASAAPAPEAVRRRVQALSSSPRKRRRFPRRLALVLVPACVAAVAGAVLLVDGFVGERSTALETTQRQVDPAIVENLRRKYPELTNGEGGVFFGSVAPSESGRARDIDMWIELRVRDADRLSDAANEATRVTRELGGFVAASKVQSADEEGRAELALRVPVAQVEEAAFRLSQLGTITGQRVVTDDLQGGLDRFARRISALSRAIRIGELKLESGTLDAEQRLHVQIRLERLRAERGDVRREHARLAARAATAELTLVLHTREAAATAKEESRIGGAAGDAADFLARAGVIAVFAAIVLSPILLLLGLAWLALGARRRRIETQVLGRTRPAVPTAEPRR
jgi:hypothetical protein